MRDTSPSLKMVVQYVTRVANRKNKPTTVTSIQRSFDNLSDDKLLTALANLEPYAEDFNHTQTNCFQLHTALQEYLDIDIQVESLRDDCNEIEARYIRHHGIQGQLLYIPGNNHLKLQIPSTLPDYELPEVLTHECSHLLLGHPIPVRYGIDRDLTWSFWVPRTCPYPGRRPYKVNGAALYNLTLDCDEGLSLLRMLEAEADQATRRLRAIFAYGRHVYSREAWMLGL